MIMELPSVEKAIGIDLILEKILWNFCLPDLKSARLVSHRWKHVGSKLLQKRTKISFYYEHENYEYRYSNGNPEFNFCSLTQLITNSNSSSTTTSTTKIDCDFPCNYLKLYPCILHSLHLNNFFFCHGSRIKRLQLYLDYTSEELFQLSDYSLLLQLFQQVPNLQKLDVSLDISEDVLPFLEKGPFFSLQNQNEDLLPKLTKLKLVGDVHPKILQDLIIASKKSLQEIYLENKDLFLLKDMQPCKINLIRMLSLTFTSDDLSDTIFCDRGTESVIKIIESLGDYPNNVALRLQELIVHIDSVCGLQFDLIPVSRSKVTNALDTVLKSSSASLKKITWGPIFKFFDVKIPIMPLLWKLRLEVDFEFEFRNLARKLEKLNLNETDNIADNEDHDRDDDGQYFFPAGFESQIFPRLTRINFVGSSGYDIGVLRPRTALNSNQDEFPHNSISKSNNKSNVSSNFCKYFKNVKQVPTVNWFCFLYFKRNGISDEDLQNISSKFPNSRFKLWP